MIDVPDGTVLEVDRLLADRRTIAAIKAVRDATRCSLLDARNWVYYRAGIDPPAGSPASGVTAGRCDMTSAHYYIGPVPAVAVMRGGTRLCASCAVTMLRHALANRRDFHLDPIPQDGAP